jgi:fibronectin type 3 domain-containing protein
MTTVASSPPSTRAFSLPVWGLLLLAAAGLAILLALPSASADDLTVMNAQMPSAQRERTSAVWTGTQVYIFGGHGDAGYTDLITRYTPSTDTLTVMNARLPTGRGATSAAWDGTYAYVFGGFRYDGFVSYYDEIVRYHPATDTITVLSAKLPSPRAYTTAHSRGSGTIWVAGGETATGVTDEVVDFQTSGSVSVWPTHLPSARDKMSSFFNGVNSNFIGGSDGWNGLDDILWGFQHDADLTQPRLATSVAYDGTNSYVFGGWGTNGPLSSIERYRPSNGYVGMQDGNFASPRYFTSAVWTGSAAYVFGGYNLNSGSGLQEIVKYRPTPGMPGNFVACPATTTSFALSWQTPVGNDYATNPITGYKILRGTVPGQETQIAQVGLVNSYTNTGLQSGQTYYYRVRAVSSLGDGPLTPTMPNAPDQPWGFNARLNGAGTQVNLGWNDGADGGCALTKHRIYRGTSPGAETFLTEIGTGTTYTDAAPPSGTVYYYRVSAKNAAYIEGLLSPTSPVAPGTPQSATAVRGGSPGQIQLTWQPPADDGGWPITNYRIYRGTAAGQETLLTDVGTQTTYLDAGLPNGVTRYYRVSAKSLVGEGPMSNTASTTTADVPGVPANVAAVTGSSVGLIRVTWAAPATDGGFPITAYRVLRGNSSGTETLLANVSATTFQYLDQGLPNGAVRYYRLQAVNLVGVGASSASVSASAPNVPGAPGSLVAQRGTAVGQIRLTWQTPGNGGLPITNYTVYRGLTSGNLSVAVVLGPVTAWNDANLPPGALRYYQVRATNAAGQSAPSATASASAPDVPTTPLNVAALAGPGAGQIRLSWAAPANDGGMAVTGYTVFRSDTSENLVPVASLGVVTSWTDSGLPNDVLRFYRVAATNAVGSGAQSPIVSASTASVPSVPTNLVANRGPVAGMVSLSWSPPSTDGGLPITQYTVYRSLAPGGTPVPVANVTSTGWDDTGLPNDAGRYYRVSATNAAGTSLLTAEVRGQAPGLPSVPPAVAAATSTTALGIQLTWQPADPNGIAISQYVAYRTTVVGGPEVRVANLHGTSFIDQTRLPGVRYYYRLAAVNGVGEGPSSGWVSARSTIVGSGAAGDTDGDLVPGTVESVLCGNGAFTTVLQFLFGVAGTCANATNYDAQAFLDHDDDYVPDSLEATVCAFVENKNLTQDGICNPANTDYGPPP